MKQNINLAIFSVSLLLSLIFPQLSWARNVEQEIKDTGVLKVGVRQDSPLFGFGPEQDGYCKDFAESLATQISQESGKKISLELVPSNTQNRWDLVSEGKVHFECGPNTITLEREKEHGIKFSSPFFVTATQIFAKMGVTEEIMKKGRIGIIPGTTNEAEIRAIYPQQQIDDSFVRRSHGIADVQLGEITGFASDGILLMGTASMLNLSPQQYTLVTPLANDRPFCAAYGMILPSGENNESWRNTINASITNSGKGAAVWDTWFTELLPYIAVILEACQ